MSDLHRKFRTGLSCFIRENGEITGFIKPVLPECGMAGPHQRWNRHDPDYLIAVPEAGRAALRVELESRLHEMRLPEGAEHEQAAEVGSPAVSVAESTRIAPRSPATLPLGCGAGSSDHEEATLPPQVDPSVDLGRCALPPTGGYPKKSTFRNRESGCLCASKARERRKRLELRNLSSQPCGLTNPARQSLASSRKRVLRGEG